MNKMKVVIVGGSAGARIACEILEQQGHEVLGFLHTFVEPEDWGAIAPTLLDDPTVLYDPEVDYFVATGDNALRQQLIEGVFQKTGKLPINVIHPTAVVSEISEHVRMGVGNLIEANAVLRVGVGIGCGTIINIGAIISHDCEIANYAQIGPGAVLGGRVTVDTGAFIGLGANIIPSLTIGKWALVAAGAAVIMDVGDYTMVAGVPAGFKKVIEGDVYDVQGSSNLPVEIR